MWTAVVFSGVQSREINESNKSQADMVVNRSSDGSTRFLFFHEVRLFVEDRTPKCETCVHFCSDLRLSGC